jgi:replicative DNA helicase
MAKKVLPAEKNHRFFQLPPQSLEAEESLLSAVLIDNQSLLDIVEILSPHDFYKPAHQKIFSGVLNLFSENEPVDLVTLTNQLRNAGHLEEVGGAVYLASLVDTVPIAVNVKHYAKIVHDKASLRRLIDKANQIAQKCFEAQGDVDGVIDFAEASVFEISENKLRPSYFALKDIIEKNIDLIEERQGKKALVTGVPTGFTRLDSLTSGLQKSDLIILAGRPSMGKTALALNIARNAAVDANIPVVVFSLEMSKEQLSMRMLCAEARVDSAKLRSGFFSKKDWVNLTDAAGVLSEASIYIDDSPDLTVMEIRAKTRRLKLDKQIGLVVIDYLQLMKSSGSAERRDLEISEISRALKGLAKEVDIPVMALSQLNRKLEERSDKRPLLSDLRESGALEQDADVVAFIYRDEVYNRDENNPNKGVAEVLLRKQRNGPTGDVSLKFFDAYTRFEDLQDSKLLKQYE